MTKRAAALAAIGALARLWGLIPLSLRRRLYTAIFLIEGKAGNADNGLRNLFTVWDEMERVVSFLAADREGGIHPKHRLMCYHDFFIERIAPGSHVLDVGCGYGAVARSVARAVPGVRVTGIELNADRIVQARRLNADLVNIEFVSGDALRDLPNVSFNAVILSNILEHIDDRVGFLRSLATRYGTPRILVRVPLFERHWQMPLRREVGANYLSDPEHFTEHSFDEFQAEVAAAGLRVVESQIRWGEIWAECVGERPDA